ncbi:MAG TPA: ribose 5-phosphate isomerase B [Vicinamibacterales bacterium]|nr:ribose 5-phosphate isomerase B [Vicinamibacterales bacterium]HOQ61231.1 ribose 5-phosphate isomerase B [Vicinamibacterales bacterium]HPK71676.1 ribose 5-phosphate isomerase B [Vicinamibacterales bacterium]
MRIAIGSDHAGFALKETIKALLDDLGVPFDDLGTASAEPADYPDFAEAVARAVAAGRADRGILICGTGIGMSIAANKISGVRAALACTEASAKLGRAHNDANILALGGRTTPAAAVPSIVRAFLATEFEGGRHGARVAKIAAIERKDP